MPTDNLKKWTEDPNYKKPGYGKEIPQTKKFKSDLDAWLTGNVVEPMANAGYPNLGAGIATVPSTLAEFLLPENTAELAPGMAGVGKMSRKAKKMSMMKKKKKVEKVMGEFKSGDLKSSSGDQVTNPKQAIAIALSEAKLSKKKKGKK